ncbi:MAG: cytochrome c3 family protein [Candidatus Omnitrophota bacterium]
MSKTIIRVVLAGLTVFGLLVVAAFALYWKSTSMRPSQPIRFPHHIHMEQAGLNCAHCHPYADKSPVAGIPAVKVCMDCHQNVATNKPEVKKLKAFWDKQQPIPWSKVHQLPWHVYFTHKRHIKAGIDCSQCHGNVGMMTVDRKVRSLRMGWCLNCHREKHALTDCSTCHK